MNTIENIRACVELKAPYQLPVFCLSEEFDAHSCEVPYSLYASDAAVIVETQLRSIERFGWDWAWVHGDDLVELESLGVRAVIVRDGVRVIGSHIPLNEVNLKKTSRLAPQNTGRMPVMLDALAGLRQKTGDDTCVTGNVLGPFTAMTLLIGMVQLEQALKEESLVLHELLRHLTDRAVCWAEAQMAVGAHAVRIDDRLGAAHVISPAHYEQWALEPARTVCEAVKHAGGLAFLSCAENTIEGLRVQALARPGALGCGSGIDLARVTHALEKPVCLLGNVNPVLLARGPASSVAVEADRQTRLMARGGMIACTGGPIPPLTKVPNLHTLVDTNRKIWALMTHRS